MAITFDGKAVEKHGRELKEERIERKITNCVLMKWKLESNLITI